MLFGGAGNDLLTGGSGNDVLIGDGGRVSWSAGAVEFIESSYPAFGGDDTIIAGDGNDILIGGAGNDALNGGDGNNVLIGDGGRVTWKSTTLQVIESVDTLIGGNDTLIVGGGNNTMIGGAGNDNFGGNIEKDLIVLDAGKVIINNGVVQSVSFGGSSSNLLSFTQSGIFNSHSGQKLGSKMFESISDMRRSEPHEMAVADDKLAGNAGMRQALELSHHASPLMTAQNMQQIIEFFQDYEFEDDGSEMSTSDEFEDVVVTPIIKGDIKTEMPDGHQQSRNIAASAKSVPSRPGAEKEEDNIALGTLVAGYVGWNVNSTLPSERKTRINRDSLTNMERQGRSRRFQKWN